MSDPILGGPSEVAYSSSTARRRKARRRVGDHRPDWLLLLSMQHPGSLDKGEAVYDSGGVRVDPGAPGVYYVKSLNLTDMTAKDGSERRVQLGDGWQSCDCPHGRKSGARGLLYCYHVAAALVAQHEAQKER